MARGYEHAPSYTFDFYTTYSAVSITSFVSTQVSYCYSVGMRLLILKTIPKARLKQLKGENRDWLMRALFLENGIPLTVATIRL